MLFNAYSSHVLMQAHLLQVRALNRDLSPAGLPSGTKPQKLASSCSQSAMHSHAHRQTWRVKVYHADLRLHVGLVWELREGALHFKSVPFLRINSPDELPTDCNTHIHV